jgi:hypothetical protein
MAKIPYEKPKVLDLSGRAVANGQNPLACLAGGAVAFIDCATGSNDNACYTGTGGYQTSSDCLPGTGAAGGSCLPGTGQTTYECAGGSGPLYPGTCTAGPTVSSL